MVSLDVTFYLANMFELFMQSWVTAIGRAMRTRFQVALSMVLGYLEQLRGQ
jgi:hypothetical protein